MKIQTISPEIAENLNSARRRARSSSDVVATGPAEKAGINAGDVIVSFDGKPIREMRDLPRLVADTPVEKSVESSCARSGGQADIQCYARQARGRREADRSGSQPEPGSAAAAPESVDVLGMKIAAAQ